MCAGPSSRPAECVFTSPKAGPADGRPVLALHGWPQHHWAYRDLLADPPPGLRIIAPDLPGYGWSGPAPHKWAKEDVASDVLALLDALGLDRVLLVAHDWGGYVGYLMVLRAPERFDGYLALNMGYPWVTARCCCRTCGGSRISCRRDLGRIDPRRDQTISQLGSSPARTRPYGLIAGVGLDGGAGATR